MNEEKKKDSNATSWFMWSAGLYVFGLYTLISWIVSNPGQTPAAIFGRALGSFLLPTLLLINGVRAFQGKKTYFWRMFAVSLTAMFALYVFSSM